MAKKKELKYTSKQFDLNNLIVVATASEFRTPYEPKLYIGETVVLNSGSPYLVVVDLDGTGNITAAWRTNGIVNEVTLYEACFHRVKVTP